MILRKWCEISDVQGESLGKQRGRKIDLGVGRIKKVLETVGSFLLTQVGGVNRE